jgi:hypothetical protein
MPTRRRYPPAHRPDRQATSVGGADLNDEHQPLGAKLQLPTRPGFASDHYAGPVALAGGFPLAVVARALKKRQRREHQP